MPCVPHATYYPTYFMHDDTWLSMCQVFIRLVPHGMCPHAMCCHVILPFLLEIREILTVQEFNVIRLHNYISQDELNDVVSVTIRDQEKLPSLQPLL